MKIKITKSANKSNLNKVIDIVDGKTTLKGKQYRVEFSTAFGNDTISLFLDNSKQSTPNPITIWGWDEL